MLFSGVETKCQNHSNVECKLNNEYKNSSKLKCVTMVQQKWNRFMIMTKATCRQMEGNLIDRITNNELLLERENRNGWISMPPHF